jgi:hypothetical protein
MGADELAFMAGQAVRAGRADLAMVIYGSFLDGCNAGHGCRITL